MNNSLHKDRSLSFETREKMSKAKMGKSRSAEARRRISEGVKSSPIMARFNESQRKQYIVISPDGTEFEIKGLNQFCIEHDLSTGGMSQVASNKRSHHKGWKCRKIE